LLLRSVGVFRKVGSGEIADGNRTGDGLIPLAREYQADGVAPENLVCELNLVEEIDHVVRGTTIQVECRETADGTLEADVVGVRRR
jgi:hypothetical protein